MRLCDSPPLRAARARRLRLERSIASRQFCLDPCSPGIRSLTPLTFMGLARCARDRADFGAGGPVVSPFRPGCKRASLVAFGCVEVFEGTTPAHESRRVSARRTSRTARRSRCRRRTRSRRGSSPGSSTRCRRLGTSGCSRCECRRRSRTSERTAEATRLERSYAGWYARRGPCPKCQSTKICGDCCVAARYASAIRRPTSRPVPFRASTTIDPPKPPPVMRAPKTSR
jgi:hypothetical protein